MAKGQTKSSASSATRKKHARKAAGGTEQALPLPKEKSKDKSGKGKGKKDKEPRVKMYIRPSKPVPVRLDPLDSLGLAKVIPPDLLVVLRRLSKKDAVTKRKAIEELRDDWVDYILRGEDAKEGGLRESALVVVLPVWVRGPASSCIRLLHIIGLINYFKVAASPLNTFPSLIAADPSHLRESSRFSATYRVSSVVHPELCRGDRRIESGRVSDWVVGPLSARCRPTGIIVGEASLAIGLPFPVIIKFARSCAHARYSFIALHTQHIARPSCIIP